MPNFYDHFAARLRERCPYPVHDPYEFAHEIRMAALAGDETRAEYVAKNETGEGDFYRVFAADGTVMGFALLGIPPFRWPITFFSHDQYRRERWRAKKSKRGSPAPVKIGKRTFTALSR